MVVLQMFLSSSRFWGMGKGNRIQSVIHWTSVGALACSLETRGLFKRKHNSSETNKRVKLQLIQLPIDIGNWLAIVVTIVHSSNGKRACTSRDAINTFGQLFKLVPEWYWPTVG